MIEDAPKYGWRGFMLDVSRHFFGVDDVLRLIDLAALYKLNVLHLHLTDDQGWRIPIAKWPELTGAGAATQVGGGAGGFYTHADYARIVAHATSHAITVVPGDRRPRPRQRRARRLSGAGRRRAARAVHDVVLARACRWTWARRSRSASSATW